MEIGGCGGSHRDNQRPVGGALINTPETQEDLADVSRADEDDFCLRLNACDEIVGRTRIAQLNGCTDAKP
jgi:hypothetical protein